MKRTVKTLVAAITLILGACASQPEKMAASYVSPLKYKDYDCNQISMEMDQVSHKTVTLYQALKKKADNDSTQMGVGLVLFWPALFFLEGGDGPEAVEYSNLKGEFEALRKAASVKECPMTSLPKSPEEIIKEKAEEEKAKKKMETKKDQDL
ncbi:MAG: metal ABC transporter ATP-binding protein [Gammaproteobacteria bacterium RIFOXYA12_FULL_61_12]|nr:MAG: metal ABC transporter ATP-binding protein [Gammaproteobacteria bacterium RIFOXYD12_FULL_61_37]OGT94514.1 MAG: metal ABC transporter ATP-binding protein [Gammaproteobacteria bacterium RIFOXYA12_FULL_61_12]